MLAPGRAEAIIRGYTPNDDVRFDAVGAWMHTVDWQTGGAPGTLWNNVRCSCTLIAPNVVIMAGHCADGGLPGQRSVRFRRNPDGTLGQVNVALPDHGASSFYHVPVDHVIQAPDADLALVFLSECVPHIDPIPVRYLSEGELPFGIPIISCGWGMEEYACGGCLPPAECCQCGPTCCLAPVTNPGMRSHRAKACDTYVVAVGESFIRWGHVCDSMNPADCGAAQFDSGGPILIESLSCAGKIEVVAVHQQADLGFHFGPFEGNPSFPIPAPCAADLSNDRVVDGIDLGILLANWSIPPGAPGCGGDAYCRSDLNCDTKVDGIDLGILLANWGQCPGAEQWPCPIGQFAMSSGVAEAQEPVFEVTDFVAAIQWVQQASFAELLQWFLNGMPPVWEDEQ